MFGTKLLTKSVWTARTQPIIRLSHWWAMLEANGEIVWKVRVIFEHLAYLGGWQGVVCCRMEQMTSEPDVPCFFAASGTLAGFTNPDKWSGAQMIRRSEVYKMQKHKNENTKFQNGAQMTSRPDVRLRCRRHWRGGDINLPHNGSLTRALRDIYPLTLGQSKVICMSMPSLPLGSWQSS